MATTDKDVAPWLVKEQDFPSEGTRPEQMEFLLRYAVLAQSFYNSQPWKFSINDKEEEINLYANYENWLKIADPQKRELYISIGCALENLLIAADHFHLGHQIAYFPENNNEEWVARVNIVTPRKSLGPRPSELFGAIPRRRTHHHSYEERPLLEGHLRKLEQYVTEIDYEAFLSFADEPDVLKEIDKLVNHGDTILYANDNFRQELNNWYQQGVYGTPWFVEKTENLATTDPRLGENIAKRERQITGSAPVVAVLSSRYYDHTSEVRVGQTFERICLESALMGIQIYPLFQLMEIKEMQSRLQELIPDIKGYPQLVFTMGYAEQEKELTPRLPLEEVLV